MTWYDRLINSPYAPHITCYLYDWGLVALNIVGDLLITLAYFVIPAFLIHLAKRVPAISNRTIIWLFSAFILACGTTHLMEVWNIWFSSYWLAGWIKLVTAAVSVTTAIVLYKKLPEMISNARSLAKELPALKKSNQLLTDAHETTGLALIALEQQGLLAKEALIASGCEYAEDGPVGGLLRSISNLRGSWNDPRN